MVARQRRWRASARATSVPEVTARARVARCGQQNLAGMVTVRWARPTVTVPSSRVGEAPRARPCGTPELRRGTGRLWCASVTSPGRASAPPPSTLCRARVVRGAQGRQLWWGRREPRGGVYCKTSSCCGGVSGGSSPGSRWSIALLPVPGGPENARLCRPAAATWSASFGVACPRISPRSATGGRRAARALAGGLGLRSRWPASQPTASVRVAVPCTGRASTTAHVGASGGLHSIRVGVLPARGQSDADGAARGQHEALEADLTEREQPGGARAREQPGGACERQREVVIKSAAALLPAQRARS